MSSSLPEAASNAQAYPTGRFDAHHPPSRELADECVHCGFCLPACPTYVLWGEEMDSPRGRIHLIQQGLSGEPLSEAMVGHFDNCLGCMACVTACPSGVQYDSLIEDTRAQIERNHHRGFPERLLRTVIFAVFPYRRRLRLLVAPLRAYQRTGLPSRLRRTRLFRRLPQSLQAMDRLAPDVPAPGHLPGRVPATGARRATVGLLTGCVQSVFFPEVNAATARVLAAEGCEVIVPPQQGCCGALSAHNGREAEAQAFARSVIDTFLAAGVERVIVNSAGCGSTMREYGRLLRDDATYRDRARRFESITRDVAEFLDELGPVAVRQPVPVTVAYHDACHLAHAQRIRDAPRRLLRAIPDLTVREIPEGDLCCGSAGIYNILKPGPAAELGDRKAANVLSTGASLLVTANPGCLMQVSAALSRVGTSITAAHIVELLDASIRGVALDGTIDPIRRSAGSPEKLTT